MFGWRALCLMALCCGVGIGNPELLAQVTYPPMSGNAANQADVDQAKAAAAQAESDANAAMTRANQAMSKANAGVQSVNSVTPTSGNVDVVVTKGDKGDKGDTGPQGPAGASTTGPQGPAGTNGTTPAFTIGNVTTLAPGSNATVTLRGTLTAPILDIGIPRGAVGTSGTNGTNGLDGAAGAAGPSGATFLGNVTITQTASVAIPLGPRTVTATLTGCQAGERVLVTPLAALPAGYGILDASCFTAGTLTVNVYGPALVIGGSYSITAKTTVFR